MDDEKEVWPPAPKTPTLDGRAEGMTASTRNAVLLMWGLTGATYAFQVAHTPFLAPICGLVSLSLGVSLLMRRQRAAQIHGMLRILIAIVSMLLVLRR